jgi:glutamine synthetase
MTVLNTIVSEQLRSFKEEVDQRIESGDKKDDAILKELQKLIAQSKSIRFEGNGYSDEWVVEAKKRGLSNLRNTPEALNVLNRTEVQELFERMGVLSKEELGARVEVDLENYILKRQIEYRVLLDMSRSTILPAAIRYQSGLLSNVEQLNNVMGKAASKFSSAQLDMIKSAGTAIQALHLTALKMEEVHDKAEGAKSALAKARDYAEMVVPCMEAVAEQCAELEMMVDDSQWPLPKFTELLFTR